MQHLHNRCNSKKKFLSVIPALVLSVCLTVPVYSMAEDYTVAEQAEAFESVSVYDEYLSWSQLDERWSSTPMGYSTIRQSGCLITCISMMAVASFSIDDEAKRNLGISDIGQFNPGVLAGAYTNFNGFTSGGAIASWGTISKIIPQIEFVGDVTFSGKTREEVAGDLKSTLAEGCYVIAKVNTQYDSPHWVYITDVSDDGSLEMADPATQESDLYSVYPDGVNGEYWVLRGNKDFELAPSYEATSPEMPDGVNGDNFENGGEDVNDFPVQGVADEYFIKSFEPVNVLSGAGNGNIVATLNHGNVVNISAYSDNYGLVESADFTGWVDMELIEKAECVCQTTGDINNDGIIDKYDLAILNTYIRQKDCLSDGVSILSSSELHAADINGDGVIDSGDIISFIKLMNN